jgi:hypothetical protein
MNVQIKSGLPAVNCVPFATCMHEKVLKSLPFIIARSLAHSYKASSIIIHRSYLPNVTARAWQTPLLTQGHQFSFPLGIGDDSVWHTTTS